MDFMYLLLFMLFRSINANKPLAILNPTEHHSSALIFITKNEEIFVPPYKINVDLDETETMYYTCPQTANEIQFTNIESSLATEITDIHFPPTVYYCEDEYKPLMRQVTKCGIMGYGNLYAVSYKVYFDEKKQIEDKELFVYGLCYDENLKEAIYAVYKIIPTPSPPPNLDIDYDNIDLSNFPKNIITPYDLSNQKEILKKMDHNIDDVFIPQKLIPSYAIADEFSRGTTNHEFTYRPQWASKAKIWDNLVRFVFEQGSQLDWLIYIGTNNTYATPKEGRPCILQGKNGSNLFVPMHWWILIIKPNNAATRGIVVSMYNQPNTVNEPDPTTFVKLNPSESDDCDGVGWNEILNDDNSIYISCYRATEFLTKKLIGNGINLKVLSLKNEKKNFRRRVRVKVGSLLNEFSTIKSSLSKSTSINEKSTASSPTSSPTHSFTTSPLSTSPESSPLNSSPEASPTEKKKKFYSNIPRLITSTITAPFSKKSPSSSTSSSPKN